MSDDREWDQPKGLRRQQGSSVSERNGKVWHSLAEIFGARWPNSYGDAPGKIWCQLFDALDDAQLRQAIAYFAKDPADHPPTTGKFRQVALLHTPTSPNALPAPDYSVYYKGSNKVMLRIVKAVGGVQSSVLTVMLKEKARLVSQYEVIAEDDHVNWEEFIDVMDARLTTAMKEAQAGE